jgi:predicted nuclease of restriction endonuclease-like (RecB) superfamily
LIVEKQNENSWGNKVIDQLSHDLKAEFPDLQGFSRRNLYDIRRFYLLYNSEIMRQAVAQLNDPNISRAKMLSDGLSLTLATDNKEIAILRQLVAVIPWSHNLLILNKIKEPEAALFYIRQTIEHNWSRAILTLQIEQNLFARQGKAVTNFNSTLPEQQAIIAQQILKDPYNFNFLTLEPKVQELELEKHLTDHITKFLLELGKGFAFIGRQYPISVRINPVLAFYYVRTKKAWKLNML